MMRRILAGAAIAGLMFGVSATSASADDGPNSANTGTQLLGQWSVLDNLTAANSVLNGSLNYLDVLTVSHLLDADLSALNNNNG
ncbi:hypothetical protein ABT294_09970 [Nonomuraea sp. NPDC000554]|uniref:hypothetical protein n=1 Tax=Nonomuraea sp. NPDC000554 TaxID=3154259 RepID=UPI00331A5C0D